MQIADAKDVRHLSVGETYDANHQAPLHFFFLQNYEIIF